jgi:hypothetical protein
MRCVHTACAARLIWPLGVSAVSQRACVVHVALQRDRSQIAKGLVSRPVKCSRTENGQVRRVTSHGSASVRATNVPSACAHQDSQSATLEREEHGRTSVCCLARCVNAPLAWPLCAQRLRTRVACPQPESSTAADSRLQKDLENAKKGIKEIVRERVCVARAVWAQTLAWAANGAVRKSSAVRHRLARSTAVEHAVIKLQ